MSSEAIETLLKRDRLIVSAALAVVTVLAWVYLLWVVPATTMPPSATMPGMSDIPFMDMSAMAPALRVWSAAEFAIMFAMWSVMMVGMMTPSAAPMILIYARVARHSAAQGKPLAATGWFGAGYLASWVTFSLLATAAQYILERAALVTPTMTAANHRIGGVILVGAGIYQWTPLMNSCLQHCRSPLEFIQHHGGFKREAARSFGLGFRHGLYCVGCCWALMALLFVGGVMNILWIVAIAALVLVEKVAPRARTAVRIAGAGFALSGLWFLAAG